MVRIRQDFKSDRFNWDRMWSELDDIQSDLNNIWSLF